MKITLLDLPDDILTIIDDKYNDIKIKAYYMNL
jgi:hypothetical protein